MNGFNTQSVTSATASGGVVTFNFASAPGFSALNTVTIAGASNATVNGQKRVQSAASNQVLVAIPGVPDGAVGGTITLKFSPLGWTRPYSGTNIGVYRQGGTASHKRYLRVYDHNVVAANYVAYARGYESMTSVSTGTGPFPTVAQVAGNGAGAAFPYDYTTDAPATQYRAWVLLGTPRFFILYAQTNGVIYGTGITAAPPLASALHTQAQCFAFGELADVTKAADAYAVALWPQNAMHTPYVARNV
ncbi:MAG: hypothetical protein K2W33_04050, partial [Burkholderiales bacterium]|nr:hypothetical protein [Burkholderiales bacterium]